MSEHNAEWLDRTTARAGFIAWASSTGKSFGLVVAGVIIGVLTTLIIGYMAWVTKWSLAGGVVCLLYPWVSMVVGAGGVVFFYLVIRGLLWLLKPQNFLDNGK